MLSIALWPSYHAVTIRRAADSVWTFYEVEKRLPVWNRYRGLVCRTTDRDIPSFMAGTSRNLNGVGSFELSIYFKTVTDLEGWKT
jgi:hypothetical protein